MVDKEFVAYFKLAHGFFNVSMLALFLFQAWVGFLIRQARTARKPVPFAMVRRHRKAGPVFALWGVLGFFSGVTMIVLDKGRIFEYPLHFLTGLSVAVLIGAVFVSSRMIQGHELTFRNTHFSLGLVLLGLYVVQIFLGLGILL